MFSILIKFFLSIFPFTYDFLLFYFYPEEILIHTKESRKYSIIFPEKHYFLFPFRPAIQLELTFYVWYMMCVNVHASPHMNTQLFQHKQSGMYCYKWSDNIRSFMSVKVGMTLFCSILLHFGFYFNDTTLIVVNWKYVSLTGSASPSISLLCKKKHLHDSWYFALTYKV